MSQELKKQQQAIFWEWFESLPKEEAICVIVAGHSKLSESEAGDLVLPALSALLSYKKNFEPRMDAVRGEHSESAASFDSFVDFMKSQLND